MGVKRFNGYLGWAPDGDARGLGHAWPDGEMFIKINGTHLFIPTELYSGCGGPSMGNLHKLHTGRPNRLPGL